MKKPPFILLAFANDSNNPLIELSAEADQLEHLLNDGGNVELKPKASMPRIEKSFNILGDRIRIFHFAGHANQNRIKLEGSKDEEKGGYVKGMAKYIGMQNGVELVFLNGCSTKKQVEYFHRAGIPAVIATTAPVSDKIAREFAVLFYTNFVKSKHPKSLRIAFDEAENQLTSRYDSFKSFYKRGLVPEGSKWEDQFPYELVTQSKRTDELMYRDLFGEEEKGVSMDKDAYLLCDRERPAKVFKNQVNQYLAENRYKHKIASLVQGPETELPLYFSKRLRLFDLHECYERKDKVLEKSRVKYIKARMPGVRDLFGKDHGLIRIKEGFKKDLKLEYAPNLINQMTASEMLTQLSEHLKVLFIEHVIYEEDWDARQQHAFWAQYLGKFWTEPLPAKAPEVYLIFTAKYPGKKAFSFFKKQDLGLAKALKPFGVEDLGLLQKVKRLDVVKWKDTYASTSPKLVDEICNGKQQLHMIDIQEKLKAYTDHMQK